MIFEGFVQFIFDNADFNIATLTGHEMFHSLGTIACTTPLKKNIEREPFERVLDAKPV